MSASTNCLACDLPVKPLITCLLCGPQIANDGSPPLVKASSSTSLRRVSVKSLCVPSVGAAPDPVEAPPVPLESFEVIQDSKPPVTRAVVASPVVLAPF